MKSTCWISVSNQQISNDLRSPDFWDTPWYTHNVDCHWDPQQITGHLSFLCCRLTVWQLSEGKPSVRSPVTVIWQKIWICFWSRLKRHYENGTHKLYPSNIGANLGECWDWTRKVGEGRNLINHMSSFHVSCTSHNVLCTFKDSHYSKLKYSFELALKPWDFAHILSQKILSVVYYQMIPRVTAAGTLDRCANSQGWSHHAWPGLRGCWANFGRRNLTQE